MASAVDDRTESLVGVDYKTEGRKSFSRNHAHNHRHSTEETKFVKSVIKNKSLLKNVNKFQTGGCLVDQEIECSPSSVSVRFSSPLQSSYDLKKDKCDDLIKDIFSDGDSKNAKVVAVNLKWKNAVKIKQSVGKNHRKVTREANSTLTDQIEFESKTKFAKNALPTLCEKYFPGDEIKVLDGNDCHGQYSTKDTKVIHQSSSNYNNNSEMSTVAEYIDSNEHKLILVPSTGKKGFDTDIEKRYVFPYTAKFTVDTDKKKVNHEHTFQLQLSLTQSPQHYGLIFTFVLNDNQVVIIKSLISVYCIYPESPQQASITTYDFESEQSDKSNPKSLYTNFSSFLDSNLRENKLVRSFYPDGFKISYNLPKNVGRRNERCSDHLEVKHKNKQALLKDIHESSNGNKEPKPKCDTTVKVSSHKAMEQRLIFATSLKEKGYANTGPYGKMLRDHIFWTGECIVDTNPKDGAGYEDWAKTVGPYYIGKYSSKMKIFAGFCGSRLTALYVVDNDIDEHHLLSTNPAKHFRDNLFPWYLSQRNFGFVKEYLKNKSLKKLVFFLGDNPAYNMMENEAVVNEEFLPEMVWGKSSWTPNYSELNPMLDIWEELKKRILEEPFQRSYKGYYYYHARDYFIGKLRKCWNDVQTDSSTLLRTKESFADRIHKYIVKNSLATLFLKDLPPTHEDFKSDQDPTIYYKDENK